MRKIRKSAVIFLTQEEVDSPNPIEIKLTVKIKGQEGSIDYTIKYPKLATDYLGMCSEDVFLQGKEKS